MFGQCLLNGLSVLGPSGMSDGSPSVGLRLLVSKLSIFGVPGGREAIRVLYDPSADSRQPSLSSTAGVKNVKVPDGVSSVGFIFYSVIRQGGL